MRRRGVERRALTADGRQFISAISTVICAITCPPQGDALAITTLKVLGAACACLCKIKRFHDNLEFIRTNVFICHHDTIL